MKKISYLTFIYLLFFFSAINGFSQKKLGDISLKMGKPLEASMTSDGQGNIACVFLNNKQFEVDFLDPQGRLTGSTVFNKLKDDKYHKIEGSVLNQKSYDVYLYSKRLKTISCLSTNRVNWECSYKKLYVLKPEEQFLASFEMDGKFYALVIPKFSQSINVVEFEGEKVRILNFTVSDMENLYSQFTKSNDKLVKETDSEIGIENISYDFENTIHKTFPTKKLYHFNGKIYLTFDDENLTHLITLDIHSLVADHKKLNFSLDMGNESNRKSGNSFIYKNRFFRTTISPDQLNITIIDLDSMSLVKSFNMFPGVDFEIQNGPMIQEGMYSGAVEEKIIKKTEDFFKKVVGSNLAIAVFPIKEDKYQIQVGSHEVFTTVNSGSRGPGFGTPMISFGMGMGIGMGGYGMGGYPAGGMGYPYNNNSSQTTTSKRVVYFNSLLSPSDFNHLDGNTINSLNGKVEEYKNNIFRYNSTEVNNICPKGENLLLGYYQKSSKKFSVLEFSHKDPN